MHKGQIFSMDFLFALILLVVFLGTIVTHSQIRTHAEKEVILNEQLLKETDSAITVLLNGATPCKITKNSNTIYTLNNSINTNDLNKALLNQNKIEEFKEKLGLVNKNIVITIDLDNYIMEITSTPSDMLVFKRKIITCDSDITIDQFNDYLLGNGTSPIAEQELFFKVAK
jgi:hypothetical protein